MANTRELNHKDAQYVWHPFTQMGVYAKNDNIIIKFIINIYNNHGKWQNNYINLSRKIWNI